MDGRWSGWGKTWVIYRWMGDGLGGVKHGLYIGGWEMVWVG